MKTGQSIIKFVLVIGILIYALSLTGIIPFPVKLIASWLLMIYGIISVTFTIGMQKRGLLFVNTAAFMIGIILFISGNYLFLNPRALIFPSTLFIIGSGFLMLFFDDMSNKIFLYASLTLFVFAVSSVWFTRTFGIMKFINALSAIIIDYSPIFIILIGVSILAGRRKTNR